MCKTLVQKNQLVMLAFESQQLNNCIIRTGASQFTNASTWDSLNLSTWIHMLLYHPIPVYFYRSMKKKNNRFLHSRKDFHHPLLSEMKDFFKKKKQNEVTFWWDGNMADGPWSMVHSPHIWYVQVSIHTSTIFRRSHGNEGPCICIAEDCGGTFACPHCQVFSAHMLAAMLSFFSPTCS